MRLAILGRNTDDQGTQLEALTKELLESLGYQRLRLNVANNAGEVDVEGEFVVPLPVSPRHVPLIAECKAHKGPLDMTDWLKFLGKLLIAQTAHPDTSGCLVALSGVNGNVTGSFDSLQRPDIRLVDSTTIVSYLEQSHSLAPLAQLHDALRISPRVYLSVDLAYYARRVYWIVTFERGEYTILNSDATPPGDELLQDIRQMVEAKFEALLFVDLREEQLARRSRMTARKAALSVALIGLPVTSGEISGLLRGRLGLELRDADIEPAIAQLVEDRFLVSNDGSIVLSPELETDPSLRVRLFVDFSEEYFLALPVGHECWDRLIDGQLLDEILRIQGDLDLSRSDRDKATQLMRLSPSALMYAIRPDAMILTHRRSNPPPFSPEMIEHDKNHFFRSLFGCLLEDFRGSTLTPYFFATREIEGISRKIQMFVHARRSGEVVIEGEVDDTHMIGEWEEPTPEGLPRYVHVSAMANHYAAQIAACVASRTTA